MKKLKEISGKDVIVILVFIAWVVGMVYILSNTKIV
jgi:hypothetical protein